jgi:hypothetical protein
MKQMNISISVLFHANFAHIEETDMKCAVHGHTYLFLKIGL